MFRSPRPAALAVVGSLLCAGAATAQDTTVDVRDLELPVRDLELEESSLDKSVRRVEERRDVRVTLAADVLFAFSSSRLGARARSRIAQAAREVRARRVGSVRIEGHTDSKGSDSFNVRLSQRRAKAVADALRRDLRGSAPRFVVEGRGESDPVAANTTEDGEDDPRGRARNRRVEIRIPRG